MVVAVLAGLLAAPLLLGVVLWLISRKYSHLPGDLGFPVFGNLAAVIECFRRPGFQDTYGKWCEMLGNHGETIAVWFGPGIAVVTVDPFLMEELSKHPGARTKEPYVYKSIKFLLPGIITSYETDKKWKSLMVPLLQSLSPARLKSYQEAFVRRSLELVATLKNHLNQEEDVYNHVFYHICDAVLETLSGIDTSVTPVYTKNKTVPQTLKRSTGDMINYMYNTYTVCFRKLVRPYKFPPPVLDDLISKCVEEVANMTEEKMRLKEKLTTYGLQLAAAHTERGNTIEEIKLSSTETFYEAVYSNTVALSAAMVYLAMHPEVQRKALEEQVQIISDKDDNPTIENIEEMVYLDRVVRETLRFVAPFGSARRVTEEIRKGDITIPKNTPVLFLMSYARTNPKYWKDGANFNPDHFLPEAEADRPKVLNSFFGLPPRNCPGSRYSLQLLKVMLSAILRNYELSTPLKPEDIRYRIGLMNEFECPYTVVLSTRNI